MDQATRRTLLISATVFVWVTAGAASVWRFKLAAKPPLTISLGTSPRSVRITVDGEKQFDGLYVETPVKVSMPPGRHKLKISRDGFIAHLVSVEGDSGETFRMEDVVLQRNGNFAFATIDISTQAGEPPVHVEIDDGLASGDTPLVASELTADQTHILSVYPKWPDKDLRFRCRFTPPAAGDEESPSVHVRLRVRGVKVRASNCDKVPGRTERGPTR